LTAQLESKTRFRKTLAERRAAFDADCREAENDLRRNNPAQEPSREEIVTLVCERRTQRDWQSHGFVVKGQIGAATVQELIERYREAHRHQDVESLRSLYIQTAAGHSALTLEKDERPLCEIVRRFPLLDVVFEPSPHTKLGGAKLVRYAKRDRTDRYLIVAGEGRLILVGDDGRRLDPGYAIKEWSGRYYIDAADIVAADAADALITGREPLFVCLMMDQ
jgi:hypothetical protein